MSRHPTIAPFAGLFALLLWSAAPRTSAAQAVASPESLPVGSVPAGSLVFVLGDPDGYLGSPPAKATAEGGGHAVSFELLDNGQGSDAAAGDGIYTGSVDGYPNGEVRISLSDQAGKSLWSDTIPIEGNLGTPRISAVLTRSHVRISLDTVGEIVSVEENDPNEEPPSSESPYEPSPDDGSNPNEGRSQRGASSFGWLALLGAGLFGFLCGLGAGPAWRLLGRGKKPGQLANAALPRSNPLPVELEVLRGQRQVWSLPDDTPLPPSLASLARSWAAGGMVLLVPQQDHRSQLTKLLEGLHGIYWLELDQPEVRQILRAAATVSACGGEHLPCLLLVDGPGALEEPLEDEPLEAVLEDLLEDLEERAPAGLATVIMTTSAALGEHEPTLEIRAGATGLQHTSGTPLVSAPASASAAEAVTPAASLPTLPQLARPPRWPLSMLRFEGARLRWAPGLAGGDPGFPELDPEGTVWSLPDTDAIHTCSVALLRTMSDRGPVLVAPTPEHREAIARAATGKHTVHWLEQERPEPRRLLEAAKKLAEASRSLGLPGLVLVVEGMNAVEQVLEDEAPDAVLYELLEDAPDGVTVVALCRSEDLETIEPTLTPGRNDQGLLTLDGAPLFNTDLRG
jgi:hypothetical protein